MELNVSTVSTVSTRKYDFLKNKKKLNIFFSSRVRAIFYWKHWKQSQKKSVFTVNHAGCECYQYSDFSGNKVETKREGTI